jgi:hypothetical protein
MRRPQGQRRGSSNPTPTPSTKTHATASGTDLIRLISQWPPSGPEEESQAARVVHAVLQDRFVGGRSSEGPEGRGENAQQAVQVSAGGDRGKRRRCPRGTNGSNRPRTHSDSNVGTYVLGANRHRRASADDTGDQRRIPDHESNQARRLLTPREPHQGPSRRGGPSTAPQGRFSADTAMWLGLRTTLGLCNRTPP